jgi:hypothetical protein
MGALSPGKKDGQSLLSNVEVKDVQIFASSLPVFLHDAMLVRKGISFTYPLLYRSA